MRYPALSRSKAADVLMKFRSDEEVNEEDYLVSKGEGTDMNLSFIDKLKADLKTLKAKYPEVLSSRDVEGNKFEAEACSYVHQTFRYCPPEALSDQEFWRYICIFRFKELVEWRHGAVGSPAHLNNYGIGNTKRNLMYRMFMRAELSYDGNHEDSYHLARLGDKDLWESHIIGVKTGNVRTIVRALLKYLYPVEMKGRSMLKIKEVRTLAKLITRLRANVFLELYEETKALALLKILGSRAQADVAATNG